MNPIEVTVLPGIGLVIKAIDGMEAESERVTIDFIDGQVLTLYHEQDCCEHVRIVEVIGDPSDLVGQPLRLAEERADVPHGSVSGSCTWTFYTFRNVIGSVELRWLGESNGYYSEGVQWNFVGSRTPGDCHRR